MIDDSLQRIPTKVGVIVKIGNCLGLLARNSFKPIGALKNESGNIGKKIKIEVGSLESTTRHKKTPKNGGVPADVFRKGFLNLTYILYGRKSFRFGWLHVMNSDLRFVHLCIGCQLGRLLFPGTFNYENYLYA